MALTRRYAQELTDAGLAVLVDDRDESAGRKFNDADLVGIPWRVILGKRALAEGNVEIKDRRSGNITAVPKDELAGKLLAMVK